MFIKSWHRKKSLHRNHRLLSRPHSSQVSLNARSRLQHSQRLYSSTRSASTRTSQHHLHHSSRTLYNTNANLYAISSSSKSFRMNRLIGKNKMFETSNSPKIFQRLITLPNFSQGDLMIRANRTGDNFNSDSNREPLSIWSKNFPSTSKGPSYMQFANDYPSDDTLNISENADVIFETVSEEQIKHPIAEHCPSSSIFAEKKEAPTPEKEKLQKDNLELSPIGESSDNIRSGEDVGPTQQASSMTESNEVVHELLEIVHAETEIENRIDEMRRAEEEDPRILAKGVVSSRLQAIIDNWRQDETYALSSRDSWTLKRSKPNTEIGSQFTNDPSLPGQPYVLRDPQDFNYLYPSEDEEIGDIHYQSQIPIRQRLRESWRNRELQKHYIRKIRDGGPETSDQRRVEVFDDPDPRSDRLPHTPSFSDHLLPHPNDLVLVSRRDIDPVIEEEDST